MDTMSGVVDVRDEPPRRRDETPVLGGMLARLKDYGLGIGVLCYVAGFVVNSFYLALFSVIDVDLLRTRYVLTGGLFLVFLFLLVDGTTRGWKLSDHLGSEDANRIPTILARDLWHGVVIAIIPFAIIRYLPAILIPNSPFHDPHDFSEISLPWPWQTFLRGFALAWVGAYIVAFAMGTVLRAVESAPMPQFRTWRGAVRVAVSEATMLLTRTVLLHPSGAPVVSRPRPWYWAGMIVIGGLALIVYVGAVYRTIPQYLGGGKPVEVIRVSPDLAKIAAGILPGAKVELLARTSDTLLFQVTNYPDSEKETTVVVEVDKGQVQSLEYSDPILTLMGRTRPVNDHMNDATTIVGGQFSIRGTTKNATREGDREPSHNASGPDDGDATRPGDHSVWYRWKAPAARRITIDTCSLGTDIDSVLAVYTGSTLGSLTRIASNDDSCENAHGTHASRVTFIPDGVTTYLIVVADAGEDREGGFDLELYAETGNGPFNDFHTNAQEVDGTNVWFHGTTRGATREDGEGDHYVTGPGDDAERWQGDHSVWFTWTAPVSGPVTIDTCSANIDSILAVYIEDALWGTSPAMNDNNSCPAGWGSRITYIAVQRTTYKIVVADAGGARESWFDLRLAAYASNDAFANALAISTDTRVIRGTTATATREDAEPDHYTDVSAGDAELWMGDHSVWFDWTAPVSGDVTIDTCWTAIDTILAVYSGDNLASLVRVTDNNNGCATGWGSKVTFEATQGSTYKIAVSDAGGARESWFDLVIDVR